MSTSPSHPDGPLVVLGASYAGGWKVPAVAGIPVVNKGITGQQSWELLARFESDVVPERPRAVLLWGFINDVFRSPREKVEESTARALESFEKMVALARANGIEPIIATEVTVRGPKGPVNTLAGLVGRLRGKTSYQDYVNGHVLRTNAALRELARKERVLLADLQPVVSDASGVRTKAFAVDDGSHISQAGYDALTRYLTTLFQERFARR